MTLNNASLKTLENHDDFVYRHIGPNKNEQNIMLETLGLSSLEALIDETVPKRIQLQKKLNLPKARNEQEALNDLKHLASKNKIFQSYIGMGYYNVHTPPVILRNLLENPGWYTAYTPYQPEVAQGRLEAIINFQQMTMDLTCLDLASASLLDEATAAAEAMALAKRVSKNKSSNTFFVDQFCFPQTINVLKTRAEYFGFNVIVGPIEEAPKHNPFGVLFQYPDATGAITSQNTLIDDLKEQKTIICVAADIMSLVLLKAPGDIGADVVLGSAQRFGVPMGAGGPHAAFFATRSDYKRAMPGRIIGVSKDTHNETALRMAMQTREQHIRREKATSNICTAQVLLANIAAFYAVYHGPKGLRQIAERIHRLTSLLAFALKQKKFQLINPTWFDTLTLKSHESHEAIIARAHEAHINLRQDDSGHLGLSIDETTTREDLNQLYKVLTADNTDLNFEALEQNISKESYIPENCLRTTDILTHPVFNQYHSETELLRYLKRLENKDLSLTHSMIALGSCTMKLNATAEMIPVTWPELAQIHPYAPKTQTQGYEDIIEQLSQWLIEITGYDAISMQPNSGAQGEYAGLLAISKYHESRGESHRNICLIPSSAHGTNPASAQMAGMKVIIVRCDNQGNIDFDDLKQKVEEVSENLAAIMITYPSTHGVYEEGIKNICDLIHQHGGQVYMDGANMNAQVGITSPGLIGSDVSHLNLHKTFCIPHGGGGPGMGPIGVKSHLEAFLPSHPITSKSGAVSAAPYGSASILPITWMYCTMMGCEGLRSATEVALLNANYMKQQLVDYYPVLYTGRNGRVAHECIIDLRGLKTETGVSEVDIAKRLMDFGFHAPTMSFPVAGTLMIEPTESESKAEMDRFIQAMIAIYHEVKAIASGDLEKENSPLHNAPHTLKDISDWQYPYTIQEACFPLKEQAKHKFWPSVNRIDDVFGDRNLMCSCPSPENYL